MAVFEKHDLNDVDLQYFEYLKEVLSGDRTNFRPAARTSASTIGTFAKTMEFDLSGGQLPMVTTKHIALKRTLMTEVVAFMRGEIDLKFYLDRGCNIWNGNGFDFNKDRLGEVMPEFAGLKKDTPEYDEAMAKYIGLVKEDKISPEHRTLGRVYGKQWRDWDGKIDQLNRVVGSLVENPFSRYHLVTAWHPTEIADRKLSLPPCPMTYQFYPRRDEQSGRMCLDHMLLQRSCDSLLGVPFNITHEALKNAVISSIVGYEPGVFTHVLADAHIYCGVGDRADFYRDNLSQLKRDVADANTPSQYAQIRDDILNRAPEEVPGQKGLDHVPYVLEQLTRNASNYSATVRVEGNPTIDNIDLENIVVSGYKGKKDVPELVIGGIKPKMAI